MTLNYLRGYVRRRLTDTVGVGVPSDYVHAIVDALQNGDLVIIKKEHTEPWAPWGLEARNGDGTLKKDDLSDL